MRKMTNRSKFILLCLVTTMMTSNVLSFVSLNRKNKRGFVCFVQNNSSNNNKNNNNDKDFNVEVARKQLESLLLVNNDNNKDSSSSSSSFASTTKGSDTNNDFSLFEFLKKNKNSILKEGQIVLPTPPPLSTIERERRLAEIELLQQLKEGDEVTMNLWSLWFSERGQTAKKKLEKADGLMGDRRSWMECEGLLKSLIQQYGIYFVEPVNRLATLYFLQSRFDESYQLCRIVLQIKPWHFGALSGIVQVCVGRGDRATARQWAELQLPNKVANTSFPPFSNNGPINPRRLEWVDRSVAKAKELLNVAETKTQTSLKQLDNYVAAPLPPQEKHSKGDKSNNSPLLGGEDDSAWQ